MHPEPDTGREEVPNGRNPWGKLDRWQYQVRRGNPDAMRQALPAEMDVDECHRAPDSREAKPYGRVLGAIGHHECNPIAVLQSLRETPACILVAAAGESGVSERGAGRFQRPRGAEIERQPVEQCRHGERDVLLDGGGALARAKT